MRKNLKISRLAIVCVLCAVTASGAYAASSVRSLGGSGTYTSASSAASAGSAGATTAVRGGSLRVTPSSGQSGSSTTISAGSTTSGRVATSPRLSIGQYLGGATSISGGGSSLRPGTGSGSSGGGSSSGGGMDPDVAGEVLTAIDDIRRDVGALFDADTNLQDQVSAKQDMLYPAADGFIIIDDNTNEIFVDVDALEQELEMVAGEDGREVELGSDDTHLLWRYVGDPYWEELIAIADITGPQGPQGEKGEPGEAANLDAYSTTEQMNQAIGNAIAALANVYATKAEVDTLEREVAAKANTQYVNDELAKKANAADVYTKAEVYDKTEVDEKVADIVAGDMDEALANKADKTYVDEQLATKADKTELANYATTESVTALDSEVDSVNATATEAALGAAQALSGLTSKEDISNKKQTLTNSATDYPSTAAVTTALEQKADKSELENFVTSDDLVGKADQSALDNLAGRVSANETGISELNTTMGSGELTTTDKTVLGAINELKSKTDGMATDGNFEEMNNKITEMEGKLDGKQDVANMAQTVTDDETKYPSSAAVYGELETKANASDLANYATTETVNQITEDVTNVTQTVTQLGDTINNAETGLAAKVDDAVAAATEAKEAADAATSAVAGKQDALGFTPENVANKSQTVVDDETKYPSSAAVYGELETKANASDVTELETAVGALETTVGNGESGLVKDVADAKAAADKASQDVAGKQDALTTEQLNAVNSGITAEKVSVYDDYADDIAGKQDALGYTAENAANRAGSITAENQSSATAYPSVGAITQWTNDRINELSDTGIPVNPDNIGAGAIDTEKIANGAVTEEKLSDELNAEIDGKANAADLGDLAKKDQIRDADVADDAAISKSKLATDVQNALDNAANAVAAPAGEKPTNSVLGTDGEGNPVWYEIVTD